MKAEDWPIVCPLGSWLAIVGDLLLGGLTFWLKVMRGGNDES